MTPTLVHPVFTRLLAQDTGSAEWLLAPIAKDIDPNWLIFGMCAQVLIALGFIGHLIASRWWRGISLPPAIGYACLIATVMLLVYAAHRRDPVFVIGQFVNILICLRLLTVTRRSRAQAARDEDGSFPVVAPDSAERSLPTGKE